MLRLLVLATVTAAAVARPELYKEKEDFQYSRSSSDDGTKSGFYGAQRGNMGGNFERSHNMDGLAQHQMGGLVRNVEGELGEGAKQKSGSVFTSGNSKGVYGSGHYDLSNLEGRNFQEGTTYDDSLSHSSLTSHGRTHQQQSYSALNKAEYDRSRSQNSRFDGYNSGASIDQSLYTDNLRASDNLQATNQYEDTQASSQSSGFHSKSGYHGQTVYDQTAANSHVNNGYGSNIRLIATPVKVFIRPGGRVAIPVAAQTYDASQGSSSTFDQNAIISEAELLNSNHQQTAYKPVGKPKHYESSYSYRKEWEKHDAKPVLAVPLAVPTVNPYPTNSELYEDNQAHGSEYQHEASDLQNLHLSNQYNVKTASSGQSRHQAAYTTKQHSASNTAAASNAYSNGAYNNEASANSNNQVEEFGSKPKSYQSSYSYHKSWERQGDPYVIKPSTNGQYVDAAQGSQSLTAASLNQGVYGSQYGTHQTGTHRHQAHQFYSSNRDVDCDENEHIRKVRSYTLDQVPLQQSQDFSEGQDLLGQLPEKLEDLGQQAHSHWDVEDDGQQTQSKWDNLEETQQSQHRSDQLENLGQQTQNHWDKLEVGQQAQNKWDSIEDLGQQIQNQWDQQENGQQSENKWDKLELEQQSQTDLGQQTQDTWSTLDTEQKEDSNKDIKQKLDRNENSKHDNHDTNNGFESQESTFDVVQPADVNKLQVPESQTTQNESKDESSAHHVQTIWDIIGHYDKADESSSTPQANENVDLTQTGDIGYQSQHSWDHFHQHMNQNNDFVPLWQHSMHNHQLNSNMGSDSFNHHNGFSSQWNSFSASSADNVWQEHSANVHSNYNSNSYAQSNSQSGSTALTSLWDKIDNLEKQSTSSQETDSFDISNSHRENSDQATINADSTQKPIHGGYTFNTVNKPQTGVFPLGVSTTEKTKIETTPIKQNEVQPHDLGRGDIEPEETNKSYEVGRGDIGTEDTSSIESKPIFKLPKTPKEIEALSSSKKIDKTESKETESKGTQDVVQNNNQKDNRESDLRVLSLAAQKPLEQKHIYKESPQVIITSSTTPPNSNYHYVQPNHKVVYKPEDIEQQNIDQQFEDMGQQSENLNQQAFNQFEDFSQQNVNVDQQSMDHQMVDFGQQSENIGHEHLEQEQKGQEFETLGQESEGFGQETLNQQVDDFGQETQQFEQETLSELGQQAKDFNHPQKEDQFENWGQHENLEQQSQTAWKGDVEDLNQQVETAWKPSENLQQNHQVDTFVSPSIQDKDHREQQHSRPATESEVVTQKSNNVDSPPEPVTEKPGFWKSVGSKITSAKDKVSSWFKSS